MITSFTGPNRFLSNFWPCRIVTLGHVFPAVEHAYQAHKNPASPEYLQRLLHNATPGMAKRIGAEVKLPDDWERCKLGVMFNLVHQKFTEHVHLRGRLLMTGDEYLIEGNVWGDHYWGRIQNGTGEGENWLGRILMIVRSELRY